MTALFLGFLSAAIPGIPFIKILSDMCARQRLHIKQLESSLESWKGEYHGLKNIHNRTIAANNELKRKVAAVEVSQHFIFVPFGETDSFSSVRSTIENHS